MSREDTLDDVLGCCWDIDECIHHTPVDLERLQEAYDFLMGIKKYIVEGRDDADTAIATVVEFVREEEFDTFDLWEDGKACLTKGD